EPSPRADNFGIPPVFGLGSAQAAPVATASAQQAPDIRVPSDPQPPRKDYIAEDPLDEIERLVGPAVHLNVSSSSATPALRSLATPVATAHVVSEPRRAEPEVRSEAVTSASTPAIEVSSVDEAILAAAAATGAHVEWVNAGETAPERDADDADAETMVAPERAGFRLNRAVVGPVVAVALLAVAGFGLYWVLGQGGGPTGPAPLLVADTTPAKAVPETDTAAPVQQSVVFNEIAGTDTGAEEQIVSRDQADTEAVVAANAPVASSGVMTDVGDATVDPNQDGLVNRKVRTVTVRPDGTIVSGDDSLAGSAILPVDRPDVPEVPGADFSTPDLIANLAAE